MLSVLSRISGVLALWLFCFTAFLNAQNTCDVCDDVHFFLSRGNNEPYPGRQGMLVAATCQGLSSCGYEDIYFSALYTDEYCQIAYDGSVAGLVQMTAYAQKCPNSKLILAGYSNGGQIAGDILSGGGGYSFNGCFQPYTPNMDSTTSPGNKIAAVIIFGDVRHTKNQPYNYGNGSNIDGFFPRNQTQLANLQPYSKIMRNWCVSTDPICAANQTLSSYVEESHLDYYDLDSQDAATWIKSVASLTDDSSFTTAIPTSLSGIVQDYATVGTATPSGAVRIDTTWTNVIASSYAPCTQSSYSLANSTVGSTIVWPAGSTTSTATTQSGTITASVASVLPLTGSSSNTAAPSVTPTTGASGSGSGSAAPSSTAASAGSHTAVRCSAVALVFMILGLVVFAS